MGKESERGVRTNNELVKARANLSLAQEKAQWWKSPLGSFRLLNDLGQRLILGFCVAGFVISGWWALTPKAGPERPPDSIKVENPRIVKKPDGSLFLEGVIRNGSGQRVRRVVFGASFEDANRHPAMAYVIAHDIPDGQAFSFSQPVMASAPQSVHETTPMSVEW